MDATPATVTPDRVRHALREAGIEHGVLLAEETADYQHLDLTTGGTTAGVTWYQRQGYRGEREWVVEVSTPGHDVADVAGTVEGMFAAMTRELMTGLGLRGALQAG